jgi:(p)ppGpp synthase/HD superfamily hydrolase
MSKSRNYRADPESVLLVARAADFAARSHVKQRRKGAAREPYINHLAEVALLLTEATDGTDAELVAAGWLHDTLEDTETEREELEARFGSAVATIVAEVTDDKSLPKHERKRLQIETTPSKSRQARMLKIADKTSNLRAMALSPPMGWDLERRDEYINWAEAVVAGCRGLNTQLEGDFDDAVRHARAAIASTK